MDETGALARVICVGQAVFMVRHFLDSQNAAPVDEQRVGVLTGVLVCLRPSRAFLDGPLAPSHGNDCRVC